MLANPNRIIRYLPVHLHLENLQSQFRTNKIVFGMSPINQRSRITTDMIENYGIHEFFIAEHTYSPNKETDSDVC